MASRTLWIDSMFNLQAASGGSQVKGSLMGPMTEEQTRLQPMTLTRTIIRCDLAYITHDAGEGSQRVSIGIGVTSQESFAANIIPDPEVATDFPVRGWVYRAQYRVYGFAADQPAIDVIRIDRDIRAQRKLDNGEAYVVMTNADLEGVAASVSLVGVIRTLWLIM